MRVEKVQNVRILGGPPENDERIYGQGLRSRSEITKAWGKFASVFAVNPNSWNIYYSSLNIERICCKEKHHVNSLSLNGSKIHAIYLVELQKIYEMMA